MTLHACTVTDNNIMLVLDGRARTIPKTHPGFDKVRTYLRDIGLARTWEAPELKILREMIDIPTFIAQVTEGKVQVVGNTVRYDGKEIHGHVVERILNLLTAGDDILPVVRFLDRAMRNPFHATALDELFRWLEASKMPLTADGCFVAYKFINGNYRDDWTNTIDNRIGAAIPRFKPEGIDSDRRNTCSSSGYHFCSWGYTTLACYPHVMLIKVAPEDVCSFPANETGKGRTMWYEVIAEVPRDELEARSVETAGVTSSLGTYEEDEVVDEIHRDGEALEITSDRIVTTISVDIDGSGQQLMNGEVTPRDQLVFKRDGHKFKENKLWKTVHKWGQREASRRLGVPRSTLQGWIKDIEEARENDGPAA